MNYKLKYARPIVTTFVLLAIAVLILLFVFIAVRQKMFESKSHYFTLCSDATGISPQTLLLYKGFEIGRVREFNLTPTGWISVHLIIYKEYSQLIVQHSVINRLTNPITSKTQLVFVKNNKESALLEEGKYILSTDQPEGLKQFKELDTGMLPDMISNILSNVDRLIQELGKDNNPDQGALFRFLFHLANLTAQSERSVRQVNDILVDVKNFTANMNSDNNADKGAVFRMLYNAADITETLQQELNQIDSILRAVNETIDNYKQPDSLVVKMIDPTGKNIITPLKNALTGISDNLDQTMQMLIYLNKQQPEIGLMLQQINAALEKAQKTLEALNNNPLFKSGIRTESKSEQKAGIRLRELPNE